MRLWRLLASSQIQIKNDVGNAAIVGIDFAVSRARRRKQKAEHADFMRLRKLFYRDNEVCLDNYETLKRRAGEA